MYRCSICATVSRVGQPLLRHVVQRPNGDTARELPVCPSCHQQLQVGVPIARLLRLHSPEPTPKPAPPSPPAAPVVYAPVALTGRIMTNMRAKQSPV